MSKKPFKKPSFSGGPRALLIGIFIMVGLLYALTQLTDYARNMGDLTYKEFLDKVRSGQVKSVVMNGQQVEGLLVDNKKFQATVVPRDKDFDLFEKHGVDYSIASPGLSSNLWYILLLIAVLTILGLISAWYINRQGKNSGTQGGGLFNMGKSRAKIFMPNTIKEKFSSVAGAHEAKEELMDVVDFLKNPGKYRKLGAQITRGVLLQGQPGTGKTLLARAVAGEAHCPFISVSGSDFVEVFVGVGASRVRDLFAQAKRNAPCIVFIDEIDAVGRQRSGSGHGGSDEREQTLNQLLTEMDGFEVNEEPIIVMAATNRADVLDKALLRSGRFDRIITVPVPDLLSREEILAVHLKKIKVGPDVDIKKLARATFGYTGADLANLINAATILAAKKNLLVVSMQEFDTVRDNTLLGSEAKTIRPSKEELEATAYHEAGHALIRILTLQHVDLDPLHKVAITPRSGGSLGVTCFLPNREKYHETKTEYLAMIRSMMGGSAAEMLVYNEMSSGASSDFYQATQLARRMVSNYGMTDSLGKVVYTDYSQNTGEKIEVEIAKILEQEYQNAINTLREHRESLDKIAALLIEKETVDAEEIYALLDMQAPETVKLVS